MRWRLGLQRRDLWIGQEHKGVVWRTFRMWAVTAYGRPTTDHDTLWGAMSALLRAVEAKR